MASCLLGDPQLLILDEPMNGLDPAGMHEMRAMISSLALEGRTVMLSSHLLHEVQRTCDAVAIVDHGRIVRQGPIDQLIRGAGAMVLFGGQGALGIPAMPTWAMVGDRGLASRGGPVIKTLLNLASAPPSGRRYSRRTGFPRPKGCPI